MAVGGGGERRGRSIFLTLTVLPHDQHVTALVLRRKENLRHHDEDLPLAGRVDVPDALHVSGVVARVVGRLDVAHEFAHLAAALPVWTHADASGGLRSASFLISSRGDGEKTLTLALRDAGGAVEVGGGVSRAGDAVVLPELRLVGPHGAADAAVHRGVVVVTRRTLDCTAGGDTPSLQRDTLTRLRSLTCFSLSVP